jgi:hypothetical protein
VERVARPMRLECKTVDEVALVQAYLHVKKELLGSSYGKELVDLGPRPEDMSESAFLRELAWVILSAGMAEVVIRKKFPAISTCFLDWESARSISARASECVGNALIHFRHEGKISAIASAANTLAAADSFEGIRARILHDPIRELQSFAYIGPITACHIAKNMGFHVAKPDRHLNRLAQSNGFDSVAEFCGIISCFLGEDVRLVDSVLWRFATLHSDYVGRFSQLTSPAAPPSSCWSE